MVESFLNIFQASTIFEAVLKDRQEHKIVSQIENLQISNALQFYKYNWKWVTNFTETTQLFWKSQNRLDLDLALSNLAQPEGICSVRLSASTSTCKTRFDPNLFLKKKIYDNVTLAQVLNRGFMEVI